VSDFPADLQTKLEESDGKLREAIEVLRKIVRMEAVYSGPEFKRHATWEATNVLSKIALEAKS
jgi:hypothetical protein